MKATLTETDYADLKEGLRRCSSDTIDAAIRYREQGDINAIPKVVFGILERYQPATAAIKLADASDTTRLVEDIGLDSLTLLEIVMSIEEVLKIRIENDELRELRTLGQLNQFLRSKTTGAKSAPATRQYSRDQIGLILPQQTPFLFLDSAELDDAVARASYTVKGDEFFLEGHFKGEPIFPASIVFEALGQVACLWVLEKAPVQTGREIKSNQVFFASLDGAHFHRKTRPGEQLRFELKLNKLRDPLAVFEGAVTSGGNRVATIERLVLAFGEQVVPEKTDAPEALLATRELSPTAEPVVVVARNGYH
jgi:acyl carrier protein